MNLTTWAMRWSIPADALQELEHMIGINVPTVSVTEDSGKSEGAVLNLVKAEASRKGCRLWRNNVGATYTQRGDFIRYGLANESHRMNAIVKSSDLIGIRTLVITQHMVGFKIGQFISREIKKSNWKYSGNERELAQRNWIELINSLGGDACFAVAEGTI